MKLVDILARKLKFWPKGSDYIVQDKDGECWPSKGDPENARLSGNNWNSPVSGCNFYATQSCDWYEAKVIPAQWQAAVDAMAAQDMHDMALSAEPGVTEATAWNGEGLPPVGTEFESKAGKGWCECIAVAHDGGFVVFRRYFKGSEYGLYGHCYAGSDQMRPIRSAEQIAAEERKLGIEEMSTHGIDAGDSTIEYTCAALWDAGYRKQ